MVVASAAAISLTLGAASANAEEPSLVGADHETVLSEVVPESLENLADAEITETSATFTENGVTTEVPLDSNAPIQLSSEAGELSVSLPFEDQAESVTTNESGLVAFDNGNESKTAVVIHDDSSVQINTIIDGFEAPTRYEYPMTVPAGGRISVDESGAVVIVNEAGEYVAGVAKPWAKDAAGGEVPTRYEVSGATLIQIVEHDKSTKYPVVADPWFGMAMISKAVWAKNMWEYSPTLKVYPTWYGRAWGAPPVARWAAWSETLSKTPRKGWPNPATASMENQFYCHYDLVRFRAPNKEYWGLDSKIPNRGYAGFVKNQCN